MISSLLRYKIRVEEPVKETNESGTTYLKWVKYIELRSNVYHRNISQEFSNTGNALNYSTEFTVRKTERTSKIDNTYRIKYNGDYYYIIEMPPVDFGRSIRFITTRTENET